jgi:hypothetical protein
LSPLLQHLCRSYEAVLASPRCFVQPLYAVNALDAPHLLLTIICKEAVRELGPCSVRCRGTSAVDQLLDDPHPPTPALGAAECATARRETHHNRLPVIVSASLWLPCPAFLPTSSAGQARLRQKDLAVFATSVPAWALADELAALHRRATLSPDYSQIS